MLSAYHITGILQASLFLLSIFAVYVQLRLVRQRRILLATNPGHEIPTYNLSPLAIAGSFAAFYTFLLLSTATEPFAHYIFWSRIPACILGILLLWEFRKDYPTSKIALLGPIAAAVFGLTILFTFLYPSFSREFIKMIQIFVICSGVILINGQLHQLWLLIKTKKVGALSLQARTLNLMKDISTVAFGIVLGIGQSWSVIAVASANALITTIIIVVASMLIERQSLS
jgi:hypothetical protein